MPRRSDVEEYSVIYYCYLSPRLDLVNWGRLSSTQYPPAVTYGPLKTESGTDKTAKYPELNRNQNNVNALKNEWTFEWGWGGKVGIQIHNSKGRIVCYIQLYQEREVWCLRHDSRIN